MLKYIKLHDINSNGQTKGILIMSYISETTTETTIDVNGEVLSSKRKERKCRLKPAKATNYSVLLHEGYALLRELTTGEFRLLMELGVNLDYNGNVDLSSYKRKEMCQSLGCDPKSLANRLTGLKKKKLILHVELSKYEISPLVFFRGDFKMLGQRQQNYRERLLNQRK